MFKTNQISSSNHIFYSKNIKICRWQSFAFSWRYCERGVIPVVTPWDFVNIIRVSTIQKMFSIKRKSINIKRMIHKMAMGNTGYPLRKFSRSFPGRGGHWGVPNTTIPYEKLTNTEIPCRKWTKYRYRIYDRWRLLNVVSISRVFFVKHVYTRNQPQPSWENVRRSWIDLYNDWKARSLDVLSISS